MKNFIKGKFYFGYENYQYSKRYIKKYIKKVSLY